MKVENCVLYFVKHSKIGRKAFQWTNTYRGQLYNFHQLAPKTRSEGFYNSNKKNETLIERLLNAIFLKNWQKNDFFFTHIVGK